MTEVQRIGLALLFTLMAMVSFVRSDMAKALMWTLAIGVVAAIIINLARML